MTKGLLQYHHSENSKTNSLNPDEIVLLWATSSGSVLFVQFSYFVLSAVRGKWCNSMCMGTVPCSSVIIVKGNNLGDFLFASSSPGGSVG